MFGKAVDEAKYIITQLVTKISDKLEAKDIVKKIYDETTDKRLVVFDRYYPAGDFLNKFPEPLFWVHKRNDNEWVLQTIRDNEESYIDRKSLPISWAGKRDRELEEATNVPGSIFCHTDCFIAVAKTKEAILKLAEIALNS